MTEKFIEVVNRNLWTKKVGQGIPVLLISGGPGMCNYLEPVAALIEEVCEVIMFDSKAVDGPVSMGMTTISSLVLMTWKQFDVRMAIKSG